MNSFARLGLGFLVAYAMPAYGSELFSAVGSGSNILAQTTSRSSVEKAYYTSPGCFADDPTFCGANSTNIFSAAAQTDFGVNRAKAFAADSDTAAAISIWSDYMAPVYQTAPDFLHPELFPTADISIHGVVGDANNSYDGWYEIHYLAILSVNPISVDSFTGMLTGAVPVQSASSDKIMLDLWIDPDTGPQLPPLTETNIGGDVSFNRPLWLTPDPYSVILGGYVTSGLFVTATRGDYVNMFNTVGFTVNLPSGATLYTDSGSTYGAAPVPEAETWGMLLAGLVLLGIFTRDRKASRILL